MGTKPLVGRLINPSDAQGSQASQVAVIGDEPWRERFAGDPSAVGKAIYIDGRLFTIVGVTQRTREIGIRMAMGSQRAGILRLILREALYLTLIGIGIGLPLAIAASRIFANMLFALSFADPITLFTASFMLILTGISAGLLPAIRAMTLEPMAALRHEWLDL